MNRIKPMKLALIVLFCFALSSSVTSSLIWDEQISKEELNLRVKTFNVWYTKLNPTTKLVARVTEDNTVRAYALENIKVRIVNNVE